MPPFDETPAKLKQKGPGITPWQSFEPLIEPQTRSLKALQNRVGMIANHMVSQWESHEQAIKNAEGVFQALLNDLDPLCDSFRDVFSHRSISGNRVFAEVDADRSIGILSILWHSISFTMRGNTKPFALNRVGRPPLFTGRIVALQGDFHDLALELEDPSYPELLEYEIASLYVPADPTAPAVMKVKHLGEEEQFFHQSEAPRLFLLKTIEMICSGGFYHERDF
jgi:hypothetical protein